MKSIVSIVPVEKKTDEHTVALVPASGPADAEPTHWGMHAFVSVETKQFETFRSETEEKGKLPISHFDEVIAAQGLQWFQAPEPPTDAEAAKYLASKIDVRVTLSREEQTKLKLMTYATQKFGLPAKLDVAVEAPIKGEKV